MIIRSDASIKDIDSFSKVVVKNGVCEIRLKNGEPVMRSFGKNDLDAIRKLRKLLDQLTEDKTKTESV